MLRSVSYEQNPVYFGLMLIKDIKAKVQKCEICQESQNTQTKETLEPHEVPS